MSTDTINRDMTEEHVPNFDYGVRRATEYFAALQNVDPSSLLDYMARNPASENQLMDALAQLAALGQEAADLLEMLP
jgi:hypothetical protein